MIKSLKQCNCFGRMISSIMSITRQNNQQKSQSKKRSRKLQKSSNKNVLNPSRKQKENTQSQQNRQKDTKQASKFQSKIKNQTKNKQIKIQQLNQQLQIQNLNQGIPQTQRSLFNQQESSLPYPSQSNQNDLPTQKSEIIMNDIGKSVNQNQNIFMNRSKEESQQNFESIYEKIVYIRTVGIYDVYQIKKKSSNQIFKAYIMKDYDFMVKLWNVQEKDAIDRYSQLYESQKVHIKNLIELQKSNCRHLLKLIDYQLKPPTIDMTNDRQFSSGSIALIFENIQQTLQDFLNNNTLDRSDKKRIIYQLVSCMKDIHQKKMSPKNLSLKNFYIDQFQNVKFTSLQIGQFGCKQRNTMNYFPIDEDKSKQNLFYITPQQLGCKIHIDKQTNMRSSYFHNGFSVISDFDKNESNQQYQDLWRLGIIISRILIGKFIFNQPNVELLNKQIIQTLTCQQEQQQKYSRLFRQKTKGLTNRQIQMIESLLKIEPNSRRSCKELLESEYLENLLQQSQ